MMEREDIQPTSEERNTQWRNRVGLNKEVDIHQASLAIYFDNALKITFFMHSHYAGVLTNLRDNPEELLVYQDRKKSLGQEAKIRTCSPLQAHLLELNFGYERV